MTMRITGMTSGLDTEAIIGELTKAYNKKTEKYEKAQTKLQWKQDAWKGLNTKIYNLYTNISNLRFSSAYNAKKATVSNSSIASVKASGNAVVGSQKLNVLSTAQSAYMTGGKLTNKSSDSAITSKSLVSELGYTGENTSFTVRTKNDDGSYKYTQIDVTKNTEMSEIVKSLQDAGINATLDENNSRLYLNAKTTGSAGNFDIMATSGDNNSNSLIRALGLNTDSGIYGGQMDLGGETVTADTTLGELGLGSTVNTSFMVNVTGKTPEKIEIDANTKVGDVVSKLSSLGLDARFEDGRINIYSTKYDINEEVTITESENDNQTGRALQLLGLGETADRKSGGVKLDGTDAKIRLNGVIYTSNTNNFSINGLDITATGITGDGDDKAITVTTDNDVEGLYDKIKDFLTEYNSIINEMTKLYNADSSKGYEPLTDEEKDAMSDTEIQKWEAKIKDSLLRRDSQLESIMSTMINSMAKTYEVDGKKVGLSSFGIKTLGFLNSAKNEQNAFHIDGDEDDSMTSGNEDILRKILRNDPDPENKLVVHGADAVIDFLKQLTGGLYTAIDGKMKSTSLSSVYTVYNDKEMNSQYSEYSKTIKKWEDKAADQEDKYYKQFAQMEKALTKMQNSTQNIAGLFT